MPSSSPDPLDLSPGLANVFGTFGMTDPDDLRRLRHAVPDPVPLIERPTRLPLGFEVTVIGDLRVDVRADLPVLRFTDLAADAHAVTSVTSDVGGTAINFARAATAHFAKVHLIGTMGEDS